MIRERESPRRSHGNKISENRYDDVAPVEAGDEGQGEEEQRCGEKPVKVSGHGHGAEDVRVGRRDAVFVS